MPFWKSEPSEDAWASRAHFQSLFVLVPGLFTTLVPTMLFGLLLGEWGSNLFWGSYFGLGWCLSAFLDYRQAWRVGLIWGWFGLLPLYLGAGWLWDATTARGRAIAIRLLWFSAFLMVPGRVVLALYQLGIHLPDFAAHMSDY